MLILNFDKNINSDVIYKYDDIEKLKEIKKECRVVKNNKGIGYYNIACSFDIETTSTYYNDDKIAFLYIWQCGINGVCFIGRNWDEFIHFYNNIVLVFNCRNDLRMIIYVHNLGYEFQFMRKWFDWIDVFSISERKPLKAITREYVEFKCSYLLTNKSLKKVGEDLQKYKIKKLVGGLDYKKIHTTDTELTEEEIQYCINDIKIVMAHIQEQIETEKHIFKIPLTQTGYVRREVRKRCLKDGKYNNKSYTRLMDILQINDLNEYKLLKSAFSGGFTHANAFNSNRVFNNVISYDFCSSYPTMMLAYDFPMSRGEYVKIHDNMEFEENLKYYCCVFNVKIYGLKAKTELLHENYISYSKCRNIKNFTINNGRVVFADELEITVTDIDWWIINQCYKMDFFQLSSNFIRYQRGKLPKEIILSVIDFYNKKTTLKGIEDKEVEYLISKQMLNSIYGMCVTDIIREPINYIYDINKWQKTETEEEHLFTLDEQNEMLENENNSYKRFLFYPWGIYVTAYARRALWSGILEFKDDYIYSDTDSIYVINADKHKDYINRYNEYIINRCKDTLKYYNIDPEQVEPKTIKGVKKPLGVWEVDKKMKRFKTVGAKRYLYETDGNKIGLTVSGVNKKIAVPYLINKYGDEIFNNFNDGLKIPKGYTGKLIHSYIDDEIDLQITDHQGHKSHIYEKSFVHLEDSEYNLSMSKSYIDYLLTL